MNRSLLTFLYGNIIGSLKISLINCNIIKAVVVDGCFRALPGVVFGIRVNNVMEKQRVC